jgi:hypothetical protein
LAIWAAAAGESGRTLHLSRRVKRIAVALAATCLIAAVAFAAFLVGEHHQRPVTVLTGIAAVGYQEATVIVNGWAYGFQGNGITWIDRQGQTHYGGWPSCLSIPGRAAPITFAEVPVTNPDGSIARQVVWVDCRA